MNLLTIEHLTKAYTERLLFDDTEFSIQEGEKIGLIGINGTGKSTLLKIVAGFEEPDQGTVTKGRGVTIGYLPQNPEFAATDTVMESVLRALKSDAPAWETEGQAKAILTRLGITDFTAKVAQMSGGQRKRTALAAALMNPVELLILDEPTNHLDSEMSDWLEEYLKGLRCSILMITHDRYFLDSVANRIVELDKGKLYSYQENYSGYLQRKAEREAILQASERKRQSILRVELEWMMRGARARSTKQKARIERYEELKTKAAPSADESVKLGSVASRLGRNTIELEHLHKAYGDKLLIEDFSYIFLKDDRIGIVGRNGCGKSTLLKMIMGITEPDSGEIMIGQTVKIGYFSQESEELNPAVKVIDYVKEIGEFIHTPEGGSISASEMLERFLFPSSVQYTLVGSLSGGERRRLHLLRILMGAPNVLILDEPTNDLDIQTLTILEDYLDRFAGIVIAVSHDRYFLDRTTRRIFAFEAKGAVVQYEGGYTDYQMAREQREIKEEKPQPVKKGGDTRSKSQKLRFSYQEQREFQEIEGLIRDLEESLSRLDERIAEEASNYSRLGELLKEKEETEQLLETKMDRWMYLEDLAERIEKEKS